MVHIEDIRIGSTLICKLYDGTEQRVSINSDDLSVIIIAGEKFTNEKYKPIPLTDREVLDMGFDSSDPVLLDNSDYDSFRLSDTKIKYVHEFENFLRAIGKKYKTKSND